MEYFDCHCDTLVKMYQQKKGFYNSGFDCDRALLGKNDKAFVVYAIFNNGGFKRADMLNIMRYYKSKVNEIKNGKAYLSIEGLGNQPDFELSDVELYKKNGVCMMSLSWNNDNLLCGGIAENSHGLTPLGKNVICEMKKCGVIADVSHSSDRACYEIIADYGKSVCASHSNARAICDDKRNLTDAQIRMIAEVGGVAGINFHSPFLSKKIASFDDVLKHIEHYLKIGGENSVGIGSDFDGTELKPHGIQNCGGFTRLKKYLLTKGYSKSFIKMLFFGNFGKIFEKYEF